MRKGANEGCITPPHASLVGKNICYENQCNIIYVFKARMYRQETPGHIRRGSSKPGLWTLDWTVDWRSLMDMTTIRPLQMRT